MQKYATAIFISLIFIIAGLITLPDYGINWDSPYRFMRGEAFLHFITTGQKTYDKKDEFSPVIFKPGQGITRFNFLSGEGSGVATLPERPLLRLEYENSSKEATRNSFYASSFWPPNFYFTSEDPGHLPLPEDLSAVSNKLVWGVFGLSDDIDSQQIPYIILSSIGIFVVILFTTEITGSLTAGVLAGIFLALFPMFFSESHFNLKDPQQASMFAGSVWTFWNWIRTKKAVWFALFSAFIAISLGIKWNLIFLPLIFLPWLLFVRKTEEFNEWFKPKLIVYGLLLILTSIIFMIAIWPAAWFDPINSIIKVIIFYFSIGTGTSNVQPEGFIGPFGFNSYPVILLLSQTPEIILAFAGIGIYGIIKSRDRLKPGYLILLWFLIPLLRVSIPGLSQYGGLRQIMEIVPAVCVLGGIGAAYLIYKLKPKIKKMNSNLKTSLTISFILLTSVLFILPLIYLHPNENLYFNNFVGGISGANKLNLIDRLATYGNVYKQAAVWLNDNAPKDSNLAVLEGYTFALSPLWLRPDISISPYHFSGFDQKGEYILSIRNPNYEPSFANLYPATFLKPAHEIKVNGVAFLTIYKNSPQFTKDKFRKQVESRDFNAKEIAARPNEYIQINLGSERKVTKISLKGLPKGCSPVNNFSFVDEVVNFISDSKSNSDSLKDHTYGLNEKKQTGKDTVDYFFPAEPAHYIRIYKLGDYSCFTSTNISSVSFIK